MVAWERIDGAYIAVDWGTSNRRAFLVGASGNLIDVLRDDCGILSIHRADYPAAIRSLRDRFSAVPVFLAGMVGSTRGWVEAPYVHAPASISDLAAAALSIAPDIFVLPGVSFADGTRFDVMRGEETQVLGALARGVSDGLFCQPGTHNKWVHTRERRIVEFSTAMTGELFALLREHGVLSGMLDGAVTPGPAFDAGLARGHGSRDLATALFGVRAEVLLKARPADEAASYTSGVLIGADVGAMNDLAGREVALLGMGALTELYARAIEKAGGVVSIHDSEAAFVAGVHAIKEHLS